MRIARCTVRLSKGGDGRPISEYTADRENPSRPGTYVANLPTCSEATSPSADMRRHRIQRGTEQSHPAAPGKLAAKAQPRCWEPRALITGPG